MCQCFVYRLFLPPPETSISASEKKDNALSRPDGMFVNQFRAFAFT